MADFLCLGSLRLTKLQLTGERGEDKINIDLEILIFKNDALYDYDIHRLNICKYIYNV